MSSTENGTTRSNRKVPVSRLFIHSSLPVYENVAARLLARMPHNALPPQEALVGQRSSKPRWELNLNTRRLRNPDGQVVPLSNGEFSLLVVLLKPGTEEQWR